MIYNEFKESLTDQARDIVSRYEKILWPDHKVLEIGSGWGIFTRVAVQQGADHTTMDKVAGYGRADFLKNTAGCEGKFQQIEADSHELLPTKEQEWAEAFDVVFVDGDHTQRGAQDDINWAWKFTKRGGTMLVDDVFHKSNWQPEPADPSGFNFGVARALWGFLTAHKNEIADVRVSIVGHGLVEIKKALHKKTA